MDSVLWEKIRQGDRDAFMQLYKGLYTRLFAFGCSVYVNQEVVKDCLHEMFCEIWTKRDELPEVMQVRSYLFTYLKRKILSEIPALHSERDALLDENIPVALHTLSYEELLVQIQRDEELKVRLTHTLQKLTPTQRTIIRMKFYEELNYEEIADQLQVQPRTVYNQVYEALKILRTHLTSFIPLSVLLNFLF